MEGPLLLWLATPVVIASDFEPVRDVAGCAISMRPTRHEDGAAMRAECVWPDVGADILSEMLAEYQRYSEYVFAIGEARIEERTDGRVLVYQRQELFGIADREVLLWMKQATDENHRTRFSWTTADERPLTLARSSIRTPRNEGYWEVAPEPDGGVRVVHEIAMDAGGSIPQWVIQLVRTRSFARIMADVRRIALEEGDGRSARVE